MFHRIFDEGLAHSSYVIACDRTRQAVVVDPRRDVAVYTEFARRHQLTLTHAFETHIHADFVSGARELAAHGAQTVAGPGADLQFGHHEAHHGERFAIGDVTLEAIHTPGHTPEHISLLADVPGDPVRVLTGDTLFVGAVGRPDLLGSDRARALARDLHTSIFDRLLALDDDVQVHPGHGAGSLCGTGIGHELHSTIGQERRSNPLLQHVSQQTFVAAVLRDLPERPAYFAELKRLNRLGAPVLDLASAIPCTPPLTPCDAACVLERGAILVDLRPGEAFAKGHPDGAINIGFGSKVGYWAGWVVPLTATVVLLGDPDTPKIEEARRQLLRVGIDDVAGYVEGGFPAWRAAGLPIGTFAEMNVRDLPERSAGALTLVDVRTRQEFESGHIPGAVHLPVGAVAARAGEIPRGLPVATICEGGYRSSLAASLLARAGVAPVVSIRGGMAAYRE